nr:MAG TPA: hypothetical protein [Caudoviricetes sp.]
MKKVCPHDKKHPRPIVVSTHPRHFAYFSLPSSFLLA